MVNFPVVELDWYRHSNQPFGYQNRRQWGPRFVIRREDMIGMEPTTLHELEELAYRATQLMEMHIPKSEHNYTIAMDLLRQQYNLNFMIICDKCKGVHKKHDEISAPER